MASPRERDHRGEIPRSLLPAVTRPGLKTPIWQALQAPYRRHHFHENPPWPQRQHHDYINVDRLGWWPRWYPYSDPGWQRYWWCLYDYYGGEAYPEYAEYQRDAFLRQNSAEWGLVVSGHYGGLQIGSMSLPVALPATQLYQHPHYYYGDYVSLNGSWWPRWFPYWDHAWCRYWWELYYYYGGDIQRPYAEYVRDMILREMAPQMGWL